MHRMANQLIKSVQLEACAQIAGHTLGWELFQQADLKRITNDRHWGGVFDLDGYYAVFITMMTYLRQANFIGKGGFLNSKFRRLKDKALVLAWL